MTDVLDTLGKCRLLAGLPQQGLKEAMSIASVRRFAEGQTIYQRGSSPRTMSVIASGSVRINAINGAGKEMTLMICGEDNWFGDAVFSPDSRRLYGAVAHEDTLLIEFSCEGFMALLETYPECYPVIIRELGCRLNAALRVISDDALQGIPARLARRLLFTAAFQHGRDDQPVDLKLTQEQLGTMLGISRQAAYRALQTLVAEELVEFRYGLVHLGDPAGLKNFIERGD